MRLDRPTARSSRFALGRLVLGLVVAQLFLLAGCADRESRVLAWRQDAASQGAEAVRRDLADVQGRLRAALAEGVRRLEERRDPFTQLAALRADTGVDGLLWEGPGAESAWSGRPVDLKDAPPPLPWQGSFRRGLLAYHQGPYLRAVVLGPAPAGGGYLTATVVLEAQVPSRRHAPFAERWLEPLGLDAVRLLPPDDDSPAPEGATAFLLQTESGPWCRVVVEPPGEAAVRDRVDEASRGGTGLVLLLLWLALGVVCGYLLSRRRDLGPLRPLGAAVLVLGLRALLVPLDLSARFPGLSAAFDPTDFGVEDPLGWLASPADFVLSALAVLTAATFVAAAARRWPTPRRPLTRFATAGVAILVAGALTAAHLRLIAVVVAQSQTPYFDTTSFVPPLPSTLLLVGLLASTAAAWLVLVAALQRTTQVWPAWPRTLPTLLPAVAAAGIALLLVGGDGPWWAPLLLPLSGVLAEIRPGEEAVSTLSSASVLVGVLATFLLFPLLWDRVLERRGDALGATLDEFLRKEATLRSTTLFELEGLRADDALLRALSEARQGPRPEGLAFYLWLRSFLAQPGEHGVVSVLGPDGRRLDDFTLTPLPWERIPQPAPPTADAGDLQVVTARGEGYDLRAVVGRVRIRDGDDTPLGTVVLTVPEPLDLAFLGPEMLGGATGDAPARSGVRAFDLAFAILREGQVVRTSDPAVSRRAASFGPPELAGLGPEQPSFSWRTDQEEGYAAWSEERGAVVAVRRERPSPADTVLALARLVTLGVGLAALLAIAALLFDLRGLRPRLQHRIFLAFFAISFIPIVLLGLATAREVRLRHNAYLSDRLATDIRRARTDLEAMGVQVFDQASDTNLVRWASQRRHDVLLYRRGEVFTTSRAGLVEAEVLPARLPAEAYEATVLDRRELIGRDASFAGHSVWYGWAPVLDPRGRVLGTVGVPLLYERDLVAEELAVTGNVLVAAYLFALVLVLVGGLWIARRLTHPLRLLAAGTRRVTAGELDVELRPEGRDELGELVTAFNAMTRELKDATERAIRAERESAWRRMARQVAHEIKNPLTPIRLMIQQMQAEAERDPEGAREAIQRAAPVVLRQIEALGRIAGDFAQFARMPRRDIQDVDVAALVRDTAALYAGSAREGIHVDWGVPEPLPPVRWDQAELRRVLVNLVGNAVQAISGEGRVRLTARAQSRGAREGVEVSVEDTGEGIPPDHVARIFEPDFSTKTAGTGLGLAMVRRTIDDLGGTIEVESQPGTGTVFRMWWPVRPESPSAHPGAASAE